MEELDSCEGSWETLNRKSRVKSRAWYIHVTSQGDRRIHCTKSISLCKTVPGLSLAHLHKRKGHFFNADERKSFLKNATKTQKTFSASSVSHGWCYCGYKCSLRSRVSLNFVRFPFKQVCWAFVWWSHEMCWANALFLWCHGSILTGTPQRSDGVCTWKNIWY